jgi:hypothetical protein
LGLELNGLKGPTTQVDKIFWAILTPSPCQLLRNHKGCCHAGPKRSPAFLFLLFVSFRFFSFLFGELKTKSLLVSIRISFLDTLHVTSYDHVKLVHMDPSTFLPKERKAGVKALKNTRAMVQALVQSTTRNVTSIKPHKWGFTGKRRPTGCGAHLPSLTWLRWKLLWHNRSPTNKLFSTNTALLLFLRTWENAPVDELDIISSIVFSNIYIYILENIYIGSKISWV